MMNSMKKIISVILAITMVFSMFVMTYAEETGATTQDAKYAKEIEIIKAMGIINGDETGAFNADANLTRAEFAQVLTVLLQINYSEVAQENAWYYTFEIPEDLDNVLLTPPTSGLVTGNESTTTAPVEIEKVQKYTDVDEEHWAYDVISQITDLGYMVGTSATEFSPEEPVTVNQVNKVLVKILGYEQFANINGGYPAGFNYIASTLKMLKGINNYGENPVTRGELAKILYNMFDVNMIEATYITDEGVASYKTSDKTFLNDVLGVYKYEGKVTDNGTTAIFGSSSVGEGEIKMGNVVFGLSEKADYVKGFIGRYVEFYAVKDEDTDKQVVIHAALAKDSQEFSVEIDNFKSIGNGKLEFIDENEKVDFIDIAYVPTIIFNGSKVESVTNEQIKAFSNGTVVAMKSGEGKSYDTIIIEGFVSMYVENVIATEKVISNGLVEPGEESEYINIDLKEENNKNREITIIKDGLNASFADIKAGTVIDVAKSKDAIKIIISDKKTAMKISSKSVDEFGDSYIYSEEGGEFLLADELVNSNCVAVPDLGADATAYFNTFGEIAYFDSAVASLSSLAILINAVSDGRGLKKDYKVRLFTDTGAFVDCSLTEKVAFTNENDKYQKIEAKELIDILPDYKDKLITYSTTDEGLISEITMPLAFEKDEERANGRIGAFYISDSNTRYASSSFDGKAFTRNSPKLFYISPDMSVDERSRYQIKTASVLSNDTSGSGVTAYNTDPDSLNATHIVLNSNKFTNHAPSTTTTLFFVVTSVKQALNIDGEPVVRVEGYELATMNGQQTFKTYESSTGALTNMISYVGNTAENSPTYNVQEGDILNIFESNGNVEFASLVYRHSANYAKNPRKMGGAFVGQENGLYDTTGVGNPFQVRGGSGKIIEVNGFTITANSASGENALNNASVIRMFDGFVLSKDEGLISVTNMDLSNADNVYKKADTTQTTRAWIAPTYVTVIDVKGSKISARAGSMVDIKTYADYGSGCSRVLIQAYQGQIYKLIVINVED